MLQPICEDQLLEAFAQSVRIHSTKGVNQEISADHKGSPKCVRPTSSLPHFVQITKININLFVIRYCMFPTSNTSKDPFFFTYTAYANRGNNFSNLGPHQVHVKNNDPERAIELVGWTFEKGYMQEDFTKKTIRPYLFNTARMCPATWGKGEPLIGAGVFKIQGTQQYFTLAFEDPFNGTKEGFKGFLMVGKNPELAIKNLQNSQPKDLGWGKYYTEEVNGRLRTVLELTDLQLCK